MQSIFIRWTYDEGSCRKFAWGGCPRGSNGNRFDSKQQCQDMCQPEQGDNAAGPKDPEFGHTRMPFNWGQLKLFS